MGKLSFARFYPQSSMLPLLPLDPMEMTYTHMKKNWSPVIRSACPQQRAAFPYAKGSNPGIAPPFVPPDCHWVNFLGKNASDIGRSLSADEFMNNARKILGALYASRNTVVPSFELAVQTVDQETQTESVVHDHTG